MSKSIKDLQIEVRFYNVKDFMGEPKKNIAIQFYENGEPYATGTVSFGEFIGAENCTYMDTNNCPWVSQFVELGYAKDTGFYKEPGFCKYPLYQFTDEFLKEHMSEAEYKEYKEQFNFFGVNVTFKYRDAMSNWKWRTQTCTVSSVEECIKIYGLNEGDVDYEIIEVVPAV